MKKLLIMGGRTIGSCELVNYAKGNNIYTIVTDYLPPEYSPAKLLADEYWDISTAELDKLADMARKAGVDGVITGINGFNIDKTVELAKRLSLPYYCTLEQRKKVSNKKIFKEMCKRRDIPVSKEYCVNPLIDVLNDVSFPVIVKPVDSSASRGFSKCNNAEELIAGYKVAIKESPSSTVLIEEFIPYDSVIIHYTVKNGEYFFSGMSDKISRKVGDDGATAMALQLFPSKNIDEYLGDMNEKAIKMLKDLGIIDGPVWIEAFNNDGEFIFNEMGFRFGGSMTNYPVKYFYGIDQLRELVNCVLGIKEEYNINNNDKEYSHYCIWPVHIKAGKIKLISGEKNIKKMEQIEAITQVHYVGDDIQNWGTAQQVFCYIHIKYNNINDLKDNMRYIRDTLKVYDADGKDMLFYLIEPDEI